MLCIMLNLNARSTIWILLMTNIFLARWSIKHILHAIPDKKKMIIDTNIILSNLILSESSKRFCQEKNNALKGCHTHYKGKFSLPSHWNKTTHLRQYNLFRSALSDIIFFCVYIQSHIWGWESFSIKNSDIYIHDNCWNKHIGT